MRKAQDAATVASTKHRRRKANAVRRSTTRSEDLVRQLEHEILGGRIPPGSRLDEQDLASRFEVSRTPVREALWHLASSGLVQIRRHQGAIVKQLTIAELIEMFQVMAELEGFSARLAARRISAGEQIQLRNMHRVCQERLAQLDHEGFFDANNEFHEIIFIASRNRFLQQEARNLRKRVNPYRRYITYQPGRMQKSVEEHEAIIRAIENGNGEEAHNVMRVHVNMLGEEASDFITALLGLPNDVPVTIGVGVAAPHLPAI